MTIRNPSFETPGANLGEAQDWTDAQSAGAEDVAVFAHSTRTVPHEDFEEEWDQNNNAQVAFGLTDLPAALFESNTHPQEPFEYSWVLPQTLLVPPTYNHMAVSAFVAANFSIGAFDAGTPEGVEDFEEEWSDNEDSESVFDPGNFTVAAFDVGVPENVEDFEEEWDSNETAQTVFGGGDITAASFDVGVPENFEDFEEEWTLTLPT